MQAAFEGTAGEVRVACGFSLTGMGKRLVLRSFASLRVAPLQCGVVVTLWMTVGLNPHPFKNQKGCGTQRPLRSEPLLGFGGGGFEEDDVGGAWAASYEEGFAVGGPAKARDDAAGKMS